MGGKKKIKHLLCLRIDGQKLVRWHSLFQFKNTKLSHHHSRCRPGLPLPYDRIPVGEGNGSPLQYFCLGNPMDRGAWRATVHGILQRVRHDIATEHEDNYKTSHSRG